MERKKRISPAGNKRGGQLTNHHIVPSSRFDEPEYAKFKNDRKNEVAVIGVWHNKYHSLFYNMTPTEVLFFLENTFWRGQTAWIDTYANVDIARKRKKWRYHPPIIVSSGKNPGQRGNQLIEMRIIPIARLFEQDYRSYRDDKTNKVLVVKSWAVNYKMLFGEMTPPEVLYFLEFTFWGGQTKWLDAYAHNRPE